MDADGDGAGNACDALPLDLAETVDTDGDRIGNNTDTDDDNDGALDIDDAFPLDPAETVDTDGDDVGNNADMDDDNDDLLDMEEDLNDNGVVESGETNPLDPDTDGDGVFDGLDALPLDPTETKDVDDDGIGDNVDTDDDDDGLLDTEEDLNGNGLVNPGETDPQNPDTDGDGVSDSIDALPLNGRETLDNDNDGVGNGCDVDDDNDGLSDFEEDTNDNGVVDAGETDPFNSDTDGDGLNDFEEVGLGTDPLLTDSDSDGYTDGAEVAAGSDPLDVNSIPALSKGDLNLDGVVDIRDILLAMRALNGQVTLSAEQLSRGDVAPLVSGIPSPDGQFSVGDLLVITRKAMGSVDF